MKSFLGHVFALLSVLRPIAIALACALVVFSNVTPAFAFGGGNSRPDKGLEQLDSVQEKSEEAISGPIEQDNDARSVMKNSEAGLNGVQGDANKENMINPENASGTTVEQSIKKALEKATP